MKLSIKGRSWTANRIGNTLELINPKGKKFSCDLTEFLRPDGLVNSAKLRNYVEKVYA